MNWWEWLILGLVYALQLVWTAVIFYRDGKKTASIKYHPVADMYYLPGDRLVITSQRQLSNEEERYINNTIDKFISGNIPALVLENGLTLSIIHVVSPDNENGDDDSHGGNNDRKEGLPVPEPEVFQVNENTGKEGTPDSTH
jgi:hypothetical protein